MNDDLERRIKKLEEHVSTIANAINRHGITTVSEKVSVHDRLDKLERELKINLWWSKD